MATQQRLKVGILGASGYTGADLVRLLALHPNVEIGALTANSHAGKPMDEVFPHLRPLDLPDLKTWEEVDWSALDVAFCALPHGTTQEIVAALPKTLKVVDLSADFRLTDPKVYAAWYGHEHRAPKLQTEAVYGLTEINRGAVREARLVACPGCYPTAILLSILPLVQADLVEVEDIIVDAKSGVTGAGRKVAQNLLFAEVGEGIHPYGIASHRHAPEMEQEIGRFAGKKVTVTFTPHLVPMNRGELTTTYLRLAEGATAETLRQALAERYGPEPFIRVLEAGRVPATRNVRGSNFVEMAVFADRIPGRAIVICTIDNLVKGSSGQAIQNMNLMCDLPETMALMQLPVFP